MIFKELDQCKNPVYLQFFLNSNLDAEVEKTKWKNGYSRNSYCFINPKVKWSECNGNVLQVLKKVFCKSKDFDEKFEMAVTGDGQEIKRISVLHSSSLAALLLLCSVTEENPLKFEIEGNSYLFTNSYFEFKTRVFENHFSNMDVVLTGKEIGNGTEIILFLESKFCEYLSPGMCNGISIEAYKNKYEELGLMNSNSIDGLVFSEGKTKDKTNSNIDCLQILSSSRNSHYCEGIKQMISHFMGVSNFVDNPRDNMDEKQMRRTLKKNPCVVLPGMVEKGATILLGEVLFDFSKSNPHFIEARNKLKDYAVIYNSLAKKLNETRGKVKVLDKIITYQELLKDYPIDTPTKEFYQL